MNLRVFSFAVLLPVLPASGALPQSSDVVAAIENYQGGLPSHWTAQKFAALNLDLELEILRSRADFTCHVVPYDDGYRVIWLAPAGKTIGQDMKTKIGLFIRERVLGLPSAPEKK
jgi:hypothetical protein